MNVQNLLHSANLDDRIFRIFPKKRFLDLVRTTQNGLVKPSMWQDPFENFFLRARIQAPEGEIISIEGLAEDWYGQCWTYREDTDAMWRIYSPEPRKDGIKVGTTVRKLFHSFYDCTDRFALLKFFCGKVKYFTEQQITDFMRGTAFWDVASGGQNRSFAELLCIKRESFEYENEIRLLFNDLQPRRGVSGVAQFGLNANYVFDEVVVDPRLNEDEATALIEEIRSAGCNVEIRQSTLYRAPNFVILLQQIEENG
jgi:hypothetical protein